MAAAFNEHRWCFVSAGRPIYPLVFSFSVIAGRLIDISNAASKPRRSKRRRARGADEGSRGGGRWPRHVAEHGSGRVLIDGASDGESYPQQTPDGRRSKTARREPKR